jgi:hypothetical protein
MNKNNKNQNFNALSSMTDEALELQCLLHGSIIPEITKYQFKRINRIIERNGRRIERRAKAINDLLFSV